MWHILSLHFYKILNIFLQFPLLSYSFSFISFIEWLLIHKIVGTNNAVLDKYYIWKNNNIKLDDNLLSLKKWKKVQCIILHLVLWLCEHLIYRMALE